MYKGDTPMNLRVVRVLALIFFALLFCAAGRADDSTKVTVEDYNKVVVGSDLRFVYKCLGRHTSISFHDGCQKTLKWETEDFTIIIQFKHNRVTEKWQSGLSDSD
jgi:hypothetical protein